MKKKIILILIFLNCSIAYGQYFNQPESIIYDYKSDSYFISNNNSGKIVRISGSDTSITIFEGRRGMAIVDNILYTVANDKKFKGYNLFNDSLVLDLTINEAVLLNDVDSDSAEYLYVTDYGGNKVYKVNRFTGGHTVLIPENLSAPNGIIYCREGNKLIIVESGSTKIKEFSITDSILSTVVSSAFSSMDGITQDQNGNIYVSTWARSAVYMYDRNFANTPIQVSSRHNGPADIFFDKKHKLLCVPNFNSNSIQLINLTTSGIENGQGSVINNFRLHQNYPNPFNSQTVINYYIPLPLHVELKIFDLLGREVEELLNKQQESGEYKIIYNGSGLPSGIYLCLLSAKGAEGNYNQIMKMTLLK